MSKDFLDYYSDNLSFIRKLGAEFAREYPKIASRLDLSSLECQDPFIERLLEGTAFLSARVEKKLDDGSYKDKLDNDNEKLAVAPSTSSDSNLES